MHIHLNLMHFAVFTIYIDIITIYIDRAKRKRTFLAYTDSEDPISLRMRAVWSGPSLSAYRIIGYHRIIKMEETMPGWSFAHAQDELNAHFAR